MSTYPSEFLLDLTVSGLSSTTNPVVNGVEQRVRGVDVVLTMGEDSVDPAHQSYLQLCCFRNPDAPNYDTFQGIVVSARYMRYTSGSFTEMWSAALGYTRNYTSNYPNPGVGLIDDLAITLSFSPTEQYLYVHGETRSSTISLIAVPEDERRVHRVAVRAFGSGYVERLQLDGNTTRAPAAVREFWTFFNLTNEKVSVP